MKIIRFYANWCHKCKLFSDKCDIDVNVDLPSWKKTMIKYQISVIPSFIALSDNNRVIGKLANPTTVEEYKEWKTKMLKKGTK